MKKSISVLAALWIVATSASAQSSISGYIVSLETARPIANATVFLKDQYGLQLEEPLQGTSDSTGFYRINGVEAGTYIVNAWTSFEAMGQRFAQVIQTDTIAVDSSLTVDFVFSENAFKYALHYKNHPLEAFDGKGERTSDGVAFKAVRPQLFINSRKDTVFASYIQRIK